jgi:ABC-type transport system involved in cytochrome bd biosynthesis fused ATPase/permease subunit
VWAPLLPPVETRTELTVRENTGQQTETTYLALEQRTHESSAAQHSHDFVQTLATSATQNTAEHDGSTPNTLQNELTLSVPWQGTKTGTASPIIIAIFGRTGTGKTTLIKNLSGDPNLKVGSGMRSSRSFH